MCIRDRDEDSRRLVTEALGPLLSSIHPRYLWRLLPLERISDKLSAGGLPLEGSDTVSYTHLFGPIYCLETVGAVFVYFRLRQKKRTKV